MRSSTANPRFYRPAGRFLKRTAIAVSFLLALSAYGLFTRFVAEILINSLQTFPAVTSEQWDGLKAGGPAAIVILSAGRRRFAPEFGGETADEISLERLRYGAKLARATGLPVLVSGGLARGDSPSLAAVLANVLEQDYGIVARWQETQSSNTAENAQYSSAMLKQDGVERIVLVTHAWHMKRAAAAFAAQGMPVRAAPTAFYPRTNNPGWDDFLPNAAAFRMSSYAIHELGGGLWYRIKYGY
jgi:uncharacterized SAM-binding protein YcdF (DUF218 family)